MFNYPQRLMEPGRTLPALVSGTVQVSTRFYVEVLLMWKFMYCGFVVKMEVCWLKSHKQAFIKATWLKKEKCHSGDSFNGLLLRIASLG